jgi:hypothetical protein
MEWPAEVDAWWIHKYEISLEYGGPEEGGWYYKAGIPTSMTFGPFLATEDDAFDQCRIENHMELLRRNREEDYEFTSVLAYRSTHYEYDVTNDPEPKAFPEWRPHYE